MPTTDRPAAPRRPRPAAWLSLALLGAAACGGTSPTRADGVTPRPELGEGGRTATLLATGSPPVGGAATMIPASGGGAFVEIALNGLSASYSAFVWRVSSGACNVPGGQFVGTGSEYPVLVARGGGRAGATATLPLNPQSGSYSVRVYTQAPNQRLVACGDFR